MPYRDQPGQDDPAHINYKEQSFQIKETELCCQDVLPQGIKAVIINLGPYPKKCPKSHDPNHNEDFILTCLTEKLC